MDLYFIFINQSMFLGTVVIQAFGILAWIDTWHYAYSPFEVNVNLRLRINLIWGRGLNLRPDSNMVGSK